MKILQLDVIYILVVANHSDNIVDVHPGFYFAHQSGSRQGASFLHTIPLNHFFSKAE